MSLVGSLFVGPVGHVLVIIVRRSCLLERLAPRAHSKVGWILSCGKQRLVRSRNADGTSRRILRRNRYYILEGGEFSKSDIVKEHYAVSKVKYIGCSCGARIVTRTVTSHLVTATNMIRSC